MQKTNELLAEAHFRTSTFLLVLEQKSWNSTFTFTRVLFSTHLSWMLLPPLLVSHHIPSCSRSLTYLFVSVHTYLCIYRGEKKCCTLTLFDPWPCPWPRAGCRRGDIRRSRCCGLWKHDVGEPPFLRGRRVQSCYNTRGRQDWVQKKEEKGKK